MGLFTLHNCCFLFSLTFSKLELDSKSRLSVPEFSGYYCMGTGQGVPINMGIK